MSLVPVDVPKGYRREGPVVTVLGSDKNLDLTTAEPSPYMVHGGKIWRVLKTTLKVGVLVSVVGAYPAMMWSSHSINDSAVEEVSQETWASPAAGVAISLVVREVEGPGWTGDKPAIAPAQQLTGQPAWQVGLTNALSDYLQLAATGVDTTGEIDPDLAAASRLLRAKDDAEMTPRLVAATEALARYNGRVHADIAVDLDAGTDFAQSLRLFAGWANQSAADLSALIGHDQGWPASREDVHAFYTARARAHVVANLINAAMETHPELMGRASVRAQLRDTQRAWSIVASQSPLVVSNQNGDGALLPNHLAAMAWHLERAEASSLELAELVLGAQPDVTLAGVDDVVLTSSP
ncbi:MAG: hypothetical protein AAF216_03620 [Pseudomonadota bacterium]